MSRWAEAFAALSGGSDTVDTVDTLRHNATPRSTVSHCVNSVMSPSEPATAHPRHHCHHGARSRIRARRSSNTRARSRTPWAESFARLDPDCPPGDVPAKRWLQFIDDIGRFLDSAFCAVAAALGWGPFDLFGCDRDRPFARIDHAGLLWLLNGDKLIALSENTATTATRTGARQTYRCKPNQPGWVLAWELAP